MKFAPHIGLSSPDDFMFPTLAGSDPINQIKFIAERGFSGIEDNFLKLRPVEVQEKIGIELAKQNLEMGCFVNNLIFDRPTSVSYTHLTLPTT
jgi:hydroxypyruvate isomerase